MPPLLSGSMSAKRLNNRVSALALSLLSLMLTASGASAANSMSSSGSDSPSKLTLVYSGNLDGELEPCGCTLETDYGGILRRGQMVKQLRQQYPDLLLISSGGLLDPLTTQEQTEQQAPDPIKNRHIISGLEQLDYDALGVQWQDLALGTDLLTDSTLPFTVSNWRDEGFPSQQILQSEQGPQVFFSQWLDPTESPYREMQASSPISDQLSTLSQQLTAADEAGMLTIIGSSLSLQQARQQLAANQVSLQQVDILLIGSAYEQFSEPRELTTDSHRTLVLQPGSRGQRLGVLHLSLAADQGIGDWQHQVLELPASVPDDEALAPWYDSYNAALLEAYMADVARKKASQQGDSAFVGAATCSSCHQQQHQSWNHSAHARAFEVLEAVNKAFDPHCVTCHSVGFQQPGGFLDKQSTPELAGVQCENCHGAGREHVKSGGAAATAKQGLSKAAVCSQCHVQDHSPKFNVQDYWPKIAH